MACIQAPTLEEQKRKLVPSVRSEIVRDLVTQMYAFCPRPDKDFIERVAKKLVQRYPFMKDQGKHVTGYVSMTSYLSLCSLVPWCMLEIVQIHNGFEHFSVAQSGVCIRQSCLYTVPC